MAISIKEAAEIDIPHIISLTVEKYLRIGMITISPVMMMNGLSEFMKPS